MIAGRKLLLADDSAAVQKVIELTFADEGMEVVSVGDGLLALAELEHVTPDVILADAFMPGLNGYELCRSIKDDKRFAQIPVMLLVSSFAPFDEAAAQRAGADDIMTKPFQSIRQLVNRVGSLLAANNDNVAPPHDTSTLGLTGAESPTTSAVISEEPDDQSNVTVLVEAAQLETDQSHEASGGACAPDIEFQTADTARLERVFDEPEPDASAEAWQVEDTIEIEPVLIDNEIDVTPIEAEQVAPTSDESPMTQIHNQPRPNFDGALLDLDESDFSAASIADDVVLDLDFEESAPSRVEARSPQPATVIEETLPAPIQVDDTSVTTPEVMSVIEMTEPASAIDEVVNTAMHQDQASVPSTAEALSAQQVDAIARRVMDQMSDKVVREIVWEVVPELSELLIKKKLAEQK
ncbi:MAG TPA: response regulator [Pyrinomonadaceae bacterium]